MNTKGEGYFFHMHNNSLIKRPFIAERNKTWANINTNLICNLGWACFLMITYTERQIQSKTCQFQLPKAFNPSTTCLVFGPVIFSGPGPKLLAKMIFFAFSPANNCDLSFWKSHPWMIALPLPTMIAEVPRFNAAQWFFPLRPSLKCLV